MRRKRFNAIDINLASVSGCVVGAVLMFLYLELTGKLWL